MTTFCNRVIIYWTYKVIRNKNITLTLDLKNIVLNFCCYLRRFFLRLLPVFPSWRDTCTVGQVKQHCHQLPATGTYTAGAGAGHWHERNDNGDCPWYFSNLYLCNVCPFPHCTWTIWHIQVQLEPTEAFSCSSKFLSQRHLRSNSLNLSRYLKWTKKLAQWWP